MNLLADFPSLSLFQVFESFVDYVAVEQLDGDNKYDAGEHGLQVTWEPWATFPVTVFSRPLLQLWMKQAFIPFHPLFVVRTRG